jgi:hypothetical protein
VAERAQSARSLRRVAEQTRTFAETGLEVSRRSGSTASIVAVPPTAMIPEPFPSESRFRLTRGWALMCATFAAFGIE